MNIGKGTDVYLFLIGMMLIAELARQEGLFDWLAAHAARQANGSATRLFALIYAVGVVVTVFLSNDATAVVLTPAVAAVAKAAKARTAAVSLHLRVHRQCRELRAADLQSGEPGDFWRHMPPLLRLAQPLRPALRGFDPGHLCRVAADPGQTPIAMRSPWISLAPELSWADV